MASSQRPFRKQDRPILFIRSLLAIAWTISLLIGAEQPKENLVETGNFAGEITTVPETLRIVTYNVHGPLPEAVEAVYSVLQANEQLRDAHVWALQEVRTSRTRNFAREMAQRLGMNYAHAIARPRGGGWEGLSFLSRLPISEVERLELPHLDTGERLRIGLFATISFGDKAIRFCNVHLPIRMNHEKRAEQLRLILDSFDQNQVPAQIVIGDFNTISGSLRRICHTVLENRGFATPFEGNAKTYQHYFLLRFKLDWIYLKGLGVLEHGIEQRVTASDHRPVWVDVEVRN
jgi:endonuclease/exonuclease/phosphatase family metal-dependent hydrolase